MSGESRVLRVLWGELKAKLVVVPSRDGALGVIGVYGKAKLAESDLNIPKMRLEVYKMLWRKTVLRFHRTYDKEFRTEVVKLNAEKN